MPRRFSKTFVHASTLDLPAVWSVLIATDTFLTALVNKQVGDGTGVDRLARSWDDEGSVSETSFEGLRQENEAHHQTSIRHTSLRLEIFAPVQLSYEVDWSSEGFALTFYGTDQILLMGTFEATKAELLRLIAAAESPVSVASSGSVSVSTGVPWYQGPYAVTIIGGIISGLVVAVVVFLLLS